jgi:hypothetical protein
MRNPVDFEGASNLVVVRNGNTDSKHGGTFGDGAGTVQSVGMTRMNMHIHHRMRNAQQGQTWLLKHYLVGSHLLKKPFIMPAKGKSANTPVSP